MAKTAKTLREKKAGVESQIEEYRDKVTADGYEASAEDKQSFERMKTEYTGLEEGIRELESIDDILAKRNQAAEDGDDDGDPAKHLRQKPQRRQQEGDPKARLTVAERTQAVDAFILRYAGGEVSEEQRSLIKRAQQQKVIGRSSKGAYSIDIGDGATNFRDIQRQARSGKSIAARALAIGDGTGNLGDQGDSDVFLNELERNMLTHGPMFQVGRVIRATHGRKFSAPTVDDTGNEGDIFGEASDVSATQDPTFGEQEWPTYKVRSKKIIYSAEGEEDVEYNLPGLLGGLCGERIGRGGNRYLTTGTGIDQPQGIVTGAPAGLTITAASLAACNTASSDAVIKLALT